MKPVTKSVATDTIDDFAVSIPVIDGEETPHVTDDEQVYANPTSVWDEE